MTMEPIPGNVLAYNTPAGAPTATGCPFCHGSLVNQRLLYGHPVCKKCYYRFANRRQCAYLIDWVLWQALLMGFGFCIGLLFVLTRTPLVHPELVNLIAWPLFIVMVLKDGIAGYSPGKFLLGVRVIDQTTRLPAGFVASLKRNLILFVPIVPLVIAYMLQKGPRLGDKWANTMVIWKKYEHTRVFGRGGRCEQCGYELQGNLSGVCPECGAAVSAENQSLLGIPGPVQPAGAATVQPTGA